MSEEQDGFMLSAFGVDLGQLAQNIKEEGSAALGQVASTVTQAVQGVQGAVEGAIDGVTGAVTGVVKAVAGAVSGSPSAGASGGGTGSFPLGGSVGRGGKNAPNDVRAVQAALGISADGQCGGGTIAAIEAFQRNMGQAKPDGRVDAGGATERALAGGAAPAPAPEAAPEEDEGIGKILEDAVASFVPVINIPGLGNFDMEASLSQAANQVVAKNPPKLPLLSRAEALLNEAVVVLDVNLSPSNSLDLPPPTVGFSGKCCSPDDLLKFRTAIETPRNGLRIAINAFNDADRAVVEAAEQGKKICYGGLATCIIGTIKSKGDLTIPACLVGAIACISASIPVQNAIRVQAKAEADLDVANGALERALANHRNCFIKRCA